MIRRFSLSAVLVAVAAMAAAPSAKAVGIDGTIGYSIFGGATFSGGTNLGDATTFVFPGAGGFNFVVGNTTGDFAAIPILSNYLPTNLVLGPLNTATFSITNGTYGSFMASTFQIVTSTPSFINLRLFGNYSGLAGFDPTFSSLTFTLTANGSDTAEGGAVLNSPAVPEPSSVILTGLGLVGLAVAARRRRVVA